MAKTTKTTAKKTAAKPAAAKPAKTNKPAPKVGDNANTAAINEAAASGVTGPALKADAAQLAAQSAADKAAGKESLTRVVVIGGHSILKGGVTYSTGDHIDLDDTDLERFLGTHVEHLEDADDDQGDDDGDDDGDNTLTGNNGETVPHPDTPAGAELQQKQQDEAAAKDAANVAAGLPSGAENL